MSKHIIVSKNDWSLHRKGYEDQQRHKEKIKEAIKKELPHIISEESIITSDGKHTVKIPIRSLNEYKIRYNNEKKKQVSSGDDKSSVGEIIGKVPKHQQTESETAYYSHAGDQPGVDHYKAEIEINDIEKALFEELELPNIKKKDKAEITVDNFTFNDIRKQGL